MRRKAGVVLAACGVAAATAVPVHAAVAETLGSGLDSYIVVLEDGVDATSLAHQLVGALGGTVGHVYGSALNGYSAELTEPARGAQPSGTEYARAGGLDQNSSLPDATRRISRSDVSGLVSGLRLAV